MVGAFVRVSWWRRWRWPSPFVGVVEGWPVRVGGKCVGVEPVVEDGEADADVVDAFDGEPSCAGDLSAFGGLVAGEQGCVRGCGAGAAGFGAGVAEFAEPGGGEAAEGLVASPGAFGAGLGCSTHRPQVAIRAQAFL